MKWRVERLWNGEPSPWQADLHLEPHLEPAGGLRLTIEARYWGDPAPNGPPGRHPTLWQHEVVELFLLGDDQRYLEIEIGPHGHWLALQLAGRRNVVATPDLHCRIHRLDDRWTAELQLPRAILPKGLHAANAYAIHGTEHARSYHATYPAPGLRPDFHRLDTFGPLILSGAMI